MIIFTAFALPVSADYLHAEGLGARFIRYMCPVLELGLVGSTMHMVDECVPVQAVRDLTELYGRLIERYFQAFG